MINDHAKRVLPRSLKPELQPATAPAPVHLPPQAVDPNDVWRTLDWPEDVTCKGVLYRAYDADRSPLYIGQSTGFTHRLDIHRRTSEWWPLTAYIALSFLASYDEALVMEKAAPRHERPRFNKNGVRGPAYTRLPLHGAAEDAAALLHANAAPEFVTALAALLASPERFPQPAPPPPPRFAD